MKNLKLLLTIFLFISITILCMGCDDGIANIGESGNNDDSSGNGNDDSGSGGSGNNSDNYTVIIINKSTQSGTFVIYQTIPEQDTNLKLYSLAWMAKTIHLNQSHSFSWNTEYSLMWADTGKLSKGYNVIDNASASGTKVVNANNTSRNTLLLSKKNDAFLFDNVSSIGQKGIFTIKTDNKIPNNIASIGIAMNGNPVIVMNAFVNMTYQFTPASTYWIIFGEFNEGEVLDLIRINSSTRNYFSKPMKIEFPLNVDEISITFKEDNSFEINN